MHSIQILAPEGALPPRRARGGRALLVGFALFASACGGPRAAPPLPTVDAGQVARQAEDASALDAPYRLVFEWSLNEPGLRVSGRGVARIEPPYRARLDLFARNGERIAAAALVDDDLRLPGGLPDIFPPAPLLWGALGVFRPGPGASITGGTLDGEGRSELRFRFAGGDEVRARLLDRRVERMDRTDARGQREELRVNLDAGERFPRETVYRHLGAVRELRLTLESVEHVESYPSGIWTPGR